MEDRILFVDDEENILAAFRRQLRNQFAIETVSRGQLALDILSTTGPYAVVVADMRMPVMDGVEFLTRVKEISPDTVRVMLTGFADLTTAIDAINDGNIFRLLTKPCPTDILVKTLGDALEQHRLITAEKVLLDKTLSSSIRLLVDVLSMVSPGAFSRTLRIRTIVRQLIKSLNLHISWEYELAGLMSQIGFVILPQSLLEKLNTAQPLSEDEQTLYSSFPEVGYRLLADIPRMQTVAEIVRLQRDDFSPEAKGYRKNPRVKLGAELLRIAADYDAMVNNGVTHAAAVQSIISGNGAYNPRLVEALEQAEEITGKWLSQTIPARMLEEGMVLAQDVLTGGGEVVGYKTHLISAPMIQRLRLLAEQGNLVEPIQVSIPASTGMLSNVLATRPLFSVAANF